MPRRRVTKATTRRPRPKLPEGDEGNNLSEQERKEKLRVFLADFDLDVTEKLNMLEAEKKKVMIAADVQFHTLISQIPVAVRKMKMKDFIAAGGTVASALEAISLAESRLSDSFPVKTSHRGRLLDSILEDTPSACGPPSHSKASTVKRTGQSRKKVLNDSTNMPPPSTSSSRSSRFRTPAAGTNRSGWDTPLVTPKFNPRLPTTPEGERPPKLGERLMSMDGSPICLDPNRRQKTSVIPLSVGDKTIDVQLPADFIPEGDTDLSIQRLHALLSSYLEQSKAS